MGLSALFGSAHPYIMQWQEVVLSIGSYLSERSYPQCYASFRRPTVEIFIHLDQSRILQNSKIRFTRCECIFPSCEHGPNSRYSPLGPIYFQNRGPVERDKLAQWATEMTTGIKPWADTTYDIQRRREALVVYPREAVPLAMQRSFPQ